MYPHFVINLYTKYTFSAHVVSFVACEGFPECTCPRVLTASCLQPLKSHLVSAFIVKSSSKHRYLAYFSL